MHDFLPLRPLPAGDPRRACDALTDDELQAVASLAAAAREVQAFCVAAHVSRPAQDSWLDVMGRLEAAARVCREHVVIDPARG